MIIHFPPRSFVRCLAAAAFAVLLLSVSPDVRAAAPSCPAFPDPVKNGFRSYQIKGVAAAVSDWTYKSYFNNSQEVDGLVKELTAYRNKLGDVKNYHTLGVDPVSPNTSIYYVGAGHERGELFFKLVYYCESDEWVLSDRPKIDSDPDAVISGDFYLRRMTDLQEASMGKIR
jgi:hypothetical protein